MKEDRQYPRYEIQQDVYMILNDKKILGDVQNISCAGAYVKIDDKFKHEVPPFEIGAEVDVIFNTSKQIIRGRILRFLNEDSAIFLAIYFLQKYNFDL